jgi:Rho GTPase-activating protein 1
MEENITSEGLFRVPPHSKLRDVLKEAYDRGQKYIVWKDNGVTLPVPPYPHAEHQDEIIAEVDPKDAYSVFMAAALIKAWYASLRQPIFPIHSYGDLKRLYGDNQDVPDLDRLRDLFSPMSEWSLLPGISREIVVRHLLPLMDAVAARQDQNKMTGENLAVCFAPALLCGPDQIEDAKMSSIIRRIFTHAVSLWSQGLREACGQSADILYKELELPKDEADWDDPVEEKNNAAEGSTSLEEQVSGITLQDNEKAHESYTKPYPELSHDEMPPPLPPRSRVPSAQTSGDSTKRKPAPSLQVAPPRYSTIITDDPEDVATSPVTYAATTDGFSPRRNDMDQPPPLPPRWNAVSDKKSGTSDFNSPPTSYAHAVPNARTEKFSASAFPAEIHITKRKTLTSAQVDNAEKAGIVPIASEAPRQTQYSDYYKTSQPYSAMALPGLAQLPSLTMDNGSTTTQAPIRASPSVPGTQSETSSPAGGKFPLATTPHSASAAEFRRPSIPASANRIPIITTGLARPVYPQASTNPSTNRAPSKLSSLPLPPPKPRNISPGLLKRMPSFESRGEVVDPSLSRKMLTPRKLNLKKQSVEDLRKLFEERAGMAEVLVETGRWKRNEKGR